MTFDYQLNSDFLTFTLLLSTVADPHHLDGDPDPACHFDADLTFHSDTEPDPDLSFHIKAQTHEKVLKGAHFSYILMRIRIQQLILMRMRIHLIKLMRIRIHDTAFINL
jgi:hypothetical protein